jgi:hypothetical protein
MYGVWVSHIQGVQAAGKKESILMEAVVKVVVYELPQLGIDARWRHVLRRTEML